MSSVERAGQTGGRSQLLSVDIIEPHLFVLNSLRPHDIPLVTAFAYQVSERVGQRVYVAVFLVDGRDLGVPAPESPRGRAFVRLGDEQAVCAKPLSMGGDVVVWRPLSAEWMSELISRHWWRQRHVSWGVLLDARSLQEVVNSLQETWPRRYGVGDLEMFRSTVGTSRKLGMVSYDGKWFSGKASPDCWDFVLALLMEMSGGELDVYGDAEGPD